MRVHSSSAWHTHRICPTVIFGAISKWSGTSSNTRGNSTKLPRPIIAPSIMSMAWRISLAFCLSVMPRSLLLAFRYENFAALPRDLEVSVHRGLRDLELVSNERHRFAGPEQRERLSLFLGVHRRRAT